MNAGELAIATILTVRILLALTPQLGSSRCGSLPRGGQVRQRRLMKELRDIKRSAGLKDGVFDADLVDDNLFEWDVWLRGGGFDPESKLAKDLLALKEYGDDHGISSLSLSFSLPPPSLAILGATPPSAW